MKLYLYGAVALLVLGLTAWGYKGKADTAKLRAQVVQVQAQRDAVAADLKTSEAERKRISQVSAELTVRLKATRALAAQREKALNEALQANPDWARTAVPDSVWDALTLQPSEALPGKAGPGVDGRRGRAAAAGQDQR